ncbi:MAG: hypothetical protein Q6K08_04520 [Thermostichales cyanobacterium GMQP_bins_62]
MLLLPASLAMLLPFLPIEVLLSTKGLMFLLLSAYGGAMWTFLSGAPRVHTIVVSDLEQARQFYENVLKLTEAELPLYYYYNYEQSMASTGFDSLYFPGTIAGSRDFRAAPPTIPEEPGLWYQLTDNAQIHVISGSLGDSASQTRRHSASERDSVKALLKHVIKNRIPHSVRSQNPLVFWVKDLQGQIVEIAEVK